MLKWVPECLSPAFLRKGLNYYKRLTDTIYRKKVMPCHYCIKNIEYSKCCSSVKTGSLKNIFNCYAPALLSYGDAIMGNEKRKRTRVQLTMPVIIIQGDKRIVTMTRDLSLKGMLTEPRDEIETGRPCSLSITLSSGITINLDAVAKDISSRGAAFDFIKMDEESFFHLYNLVRLHSANPDRVEKEITNPAFDSDLLDRSRK